MAAKPSRRSSSWTVSSMRQPGGRLALAYCLAAGRGAAHTRSSAQLHAAAKLSFLASTVSPPRRFPVSGPVAGFWSTSPGPCPLPASATATSWWRSGHLVLELLEDHLPVRDVVASEGPLICHAHLLAEACDQRARRRNGEIANANPDEAALVHARRTRSAHGRGNQVCGRKYGFRREGSPIVVRS